MKTISFSSKVEQAIGLLLVIILSPVLISCTKDGTVSSESVTDIKSKQLAVANVAAVGTIGAAGNALYEVWTKVTGNDVAQVPLSATPTTSTQLTTLEPAATGATDYAARIRAYVIPPTTGNYTFWIAADDSGELWLSKNDNPATKTKIAFTLSWTNLRQWTKFASQKSAPVALTAGQKYYLEVLHKQGGGGGNLSVQWTLPNGTVETPIPASRLATYVSGAGDNTVYTPSPVLNLYGQHDITISGKLFSGGDLPLITLTNCYNIKITGNKFANSSKVGIYLYNSKNITIENNFFTLVSTGVYAERTESGGIVVNNNQFLNMKGPFPRGQFVQFNNVRGPGSSVSYNKGENILGQSYPEDGISMYESSGTAASPTKIVGNWIRGGGPSASGGGVMIGDRGGSYLTATDNILVDPGEYGMAIAGGDHNIVSNNMIYGKQQYFTNVGLYINDIGGFKTTNCTMANNKVRYFNKVNYMNNAWISPNSGKPAGWDTNIFGANIDASILPAVIITKK